MDSAVNLARKDANHRGIAWKDGGGYPEGEGWDRDRKKGLRSR